jgi:hypothetical protein
VANTVTIDATYTQPPDGTIPVPGTAAITFTLNTSVSIRLDLVTARLSTGQLFDGNSATMLNSGPRTRTRRTRLKVSADRACRDHALHRVRADRLGHGRVAGRHARHEGAGGVYHGDRLSQSVTASANSGEHLLVIGAGNTSPPTGPA